MFVYPSENPCSSLKNYWCETNRICLVVAKWLLVFTHAISLHLPNLYQSSAGCCTCPLHWEKQPKRVTFTHHLFCKNHTPSELPVRMQKSTVFSCVWMVNPNKLFSFFQLELFLRIMVGKRSSYS
jgi:hypothetical protein